ncbi:superfamily II DNA or RNA helicase [Salirhabdus euzebyi]|uniref:Superfamily II DNA or RNA helicase n=1 Tax=Salirhabdus euzebyi TaxID=394506 RepID=A0A841PY81_9BACI|nr:DEAD/DEAH box helicase [Salirhabdus euzebyi]MBB6452566.1 superfamily II DNA or RNA helicase [Salirhabdus euzebyi]
MENIVDSLKESLYKGFIDHSHNKSDVFKPKLLVNNLLQSEDVLSSLLEELNYCQEFFFSVAFITESGLATLKSYLWDLKQRGIKGRILTSTFLQFNKPKVFRELLKMSNVEVRLTDLKGFHSKGYIFRHNTHYSLIVGSSNLTAHALKVNYEWNVKLTSHENGEIIHHFLEQFEDVWNESYMLNPLWIDQYEKTFVEREYLPDLEKVVEIPDEYRANPLKEAIEISPNKMQKAALQNIQMVRENNNNKGLVISATGTGKTYLSAFDVRNYAPKRMLFIVHREQILQKAKSDYQKILGGLSKDFGILSGSSKQSDVRYLFATIQTISKENVLRQFDSKEFDYILIDEVHRAGAESYLRVLNYFEPKFLLGMTATPERTDNFNIYELFDYNIAYEIRLQEALEENMLCPFHYFGVTDFELNGELIDETATLSKLVTEERVNHIIEKVHYYGHSGDSVKGLMFCSGKDEAQRLSVALNEKGLRTVALTGDDSQEERILQVNRLENGQLDYVITVDIFNEGIDIPSVNQVVMLRQTQSAIIFIQQLGRGLRKHGSKDFVTIIDFIGNYRNNYLIPVALSGDKSQNKDNVRRNMKDKSYIKGVSTINFEEIAAKQVFKAINDSKLTSLKILREAYMELKNRIGRIPYLMDFIKQNSIDPEVIVGEHTNYYQFLIKMKEEVPDLSLYEQQVLTFLSLEVLNGKRKHEVLLVELLLNRDEVVNTEYIQQLAANNCYIDEDTLYSIERIFNQEFFTQISRKKYGEIPIITRLDNTYKFNDAIKQSITSNAYFRGLINDLVETAKMKTEKYDSTQPLTLYKKYSRKDACKLLNWHNDESSTMYGYKPKHDTCPIFITYHKDEDIDASVKYGDEFLNPKLIKYFTKSNRTLQSEEVKKIIYADERNFDIHIFVKKDDDEGTDFYYLGTAHPVKDTAEQTVMLDKNDKEIPVVTLELMLEHSIEPKLYHYITNK